MRVISDEELLQILDRQLPEMLERNPELEPRAFRAFMKAFATKESVAAVLDELRALDAKVLHFRAESVAGYEQLRQDLHELRTEMERRFEGVEDRLDKVEDRLDKVEDRLEKVEDRLEKVEGRLEKVEGRLEKVESRLEKVEGRLDKVEGRLEKVESRLEKVEGRLDKVEGRLEKVEGRLEKVECDIHQLGQKFDDLRDWVELIVGRFQVRSGRRLEDVVAGALRLALKRSDISPESIRMRQKIIDEQGIIGPAGRQYEVDILAEDNRLLVFEVKSVCELEDVDRLADKVHLMRTLHPGRRIEGVLIALAGERGTKEQCTEYGITPVFREEG